MKQAPQIINAESLRKEWPLASNGGPWVLARPESAGGLLTRIRIAYRVFTGDMDALKWREPQSAGKAES